LDDIIDYYTRLDPSMPYAMNEWTDSVTQFLRETDVLKHYQTMLALVQSDPTTEVPRMGCFSRQRFLIAAHFSKRPEALQDASSKVRSYFAKRNTSNKKEVPIVVDTGASWSVSPNIEDFVSIISAPDVTSLRSLDGSIKVEGQGVVEWVIQDMDDKVCVLITNCLYIPTAEV